VPRRDDLDDALGLSRDSEKLEVRLSGIDVVDRDGDLAARRGEIVANGRTRERINCDSGQSTCLSTSRATVDSSVLTVTSVTASDPMAELPGARGSSSQSLQKELIAQLGL
jgi:hypothetical protein